MLSDLKTAFRSLRKSPGPTLLGILVLGLGIGANSAMFSVVNTLVLKPLAVPAPEQLVVVLRNDREQRSWDSISYPGFLDLRDSLETFEDLTAHTLAMVAIGEGADARRSFVDVVASNYFEMFGVSLARGRSFTAEEERPNAQLPVAIISHKFWQRLGGEDSVVGSQLLVNGLSTTIVGVAPRGFSGTSALLAPEVYMPLGMDAQLGATLSDGPPQQLSERTTRKLLLIGRLAEGTSRTTANADLERVSMALGEQFPGTNRSVVFEAHAPSRVSISTSPQQDDELVVLSALLLAMALIVLLVAGFNLAALQDARNLTRRTEIGVRLALGSGRGRLVRLLVIECLLLAAGGALLGLGIASVAPRLLAGSLSQLAPFDVFLDGALDWRIAAATAGFAVLAALFVGLLPSLRASRLNLVAELKEDKQVGGSGRKLLGLARGDVPVLFQLALSMVLLVSAALFVMSSIRGANVDPGFEVDRHALLEVDPSLAGYEQTRTQDFQARLRTELSAVPGVRSVAYASTTPFGMASSSTRVLDADRAAPDPNEQAGTASALYTVSEGYFETLGIRMKSGREFRSSESRPVVIVDEVLARTLFEGSEAVGRRVRFVNSRRLQEPAEIVGVVSNVRNSLFEREEAPVVYLPTARNPITNTQVHVATDLAPSASLVQALRDTSRSVDATVPILTLQPFRTFLDSSFEVWTLRTAARLFSVFAAVALFLVAAGVYGIQAFRTAQRTREIGLRIALGATLRNTVQLILRDGVRVAIFGVFLGGLLSLITARLLASMLFQVSTVEPSVFLSVSVLLMAAVVGASLLPAVRAAHQDPLAAIRDD